jgi:homoserine kinase
MKQAALSTGAIGFGISGSGPTVFALCRSEVQAHLTTKTLNKLLDGFGIESDSFVSKINPNGAQLIT